MATEVSLDAQGSRAKVRHPVAVPALTLVTLGIYSLYWWYQVNREMVDYGRARNVDLGDSPTTSLLAMFPGGLVIVPAIMSFYNGVGRMQRAQETALGQRSLSGWVVLGVIVGGFIVPFLGLVAYGYMQAELNKVWESGGTGELGPGDPAMSAYSGHAAGQPATPPPPPGA